MTTDHNQFALSQLPIHMILTCVHDHPNPPHPGQSNCVTMETEERA